jgi:hypothetical protein
MITVHAIERAEEETGGRDKQEEKLQDSTRTNKCIHQKDEH